MVRTPLQLWDLDNRVPAEGTDTIEAIAYSRNRLPTHRGIRRHPAPGASALLYPHHGDAPSRKRRLMRRTDCRPWFQLRVT
jgi:hypothetical protein